jgi:hypothetical protein
MHYNEIQLDNHSIFLSHKYLYHSFQTLTTLKLVHNNIGAVGAQHLAYALQQNKVRSLPYPSILRIFASFNTGTDYIGSYEQQNRC